MKVIKASEFSSYSFCRRAWWYAAMGIQPDNQQALAEGAAAHDSHGGRVRSIRMLQVAALLCILLSLLILIAYWLVGT